MLRKKRAVSIYGDLRKGSAVFEVTMSTRTHGRQQSAKDLNVCASRAMLSIGMHVAVLKDDAIVGYWVGTCIIFSCLILFLGSSSAVN